jgi:hypothetical protein
MAERGQRQRDRRSGDARAAGRGDRLVEIDAGLGKWLLGQAVATAWGMKPGRVTVNTNTLDHPAALPLYQRVGFVPVGQTETFIHPLTDEDHLRLASLD